ncbi:MAG: pro-sigmaK processing inhibitor BofA family protein [Clostridium argentinense]|uniref:Pro-sigmaK processing inhibitor BofA family protein n=1 Tax=Clostridium faecium TaxID=2762223 RepID=A0ABR8YNB3_9CLOT|nr:pro-sigmaK processing inhibitor BofA family protein [Clostridium faecium]MBS5824119.1 pro-sigmaK processing inhibitor BofA family protein [Clostridium argentinense]
MKGDEFVEYGIFFIIAVLGLIIIGKLFAWPLKILGKLVINAIAGGILLFLINFVGGPFGIDIAINPTTALIAGFLGVPGVLFLIIFKAFM